MLERFSHFDIFEWIGFLGVVTNLLAFSVSDIMKLRAFALLSNLSGLTYALARGLLPGALQNTILLPINVFRLWQMRRLIADVRAAADGDFNMDWLKPFMRARTVAAGEHLFRRGDAASEAFFIVSGEVEIPEHGVAVKPGALIGEIGLFTRGRLRTASARCLGEVRLLYISYEEFERLCFQNPQFSFYLMRLIVMRLEANAKAGGPPTALGAT